MVAFLATHKCLLGSLELLIAFAVSHYFHPFIFLGAFPEAVESPGLLGYQSRQLQPRTLLNLGSGDSRKPVRCQLPLHVIELSSTALLLCA